MLNRAVVGVLQENGGKMEQKQSEQIMTMTFVKLTKEGKTTFQRV